MPRGVLVREVPVRLVDLSASGCLVASERMVPEGATGMLCVTTSGHAYSDAVRILRTTTLPGSTPALTVAGEFSLGVQRRANRRVRSLVPDSRR